MEKEIQFIHILDNDGPGRPGQEIGLSIDGKFYIRNARSGYPINRLWLEWKTGMTFAEMQRIVHAFEKYINFV